jgi:hypothetical protein
MSRETDLRDKGMNGSATGRPRVEGADPAGSAESRPPGTTPTPEEGARLIRAFARIQDRAARAAVLDLVAAVSKGAGDETAGLLPLTTRQ